MKNLFLFILLSITTTVTAQTKTIIWENKVIEQGIDQIVKGTDTTFLYRYHNPMDNQADFFRGILFKNKEELVQFLDHCQEVFDNGKVLSSGEYSITKTKEYLTVNVDKGSGWFHMYVESIIKIKEVI